MRLSRVVLFAPLAGCFVGGTHESFEVLEPIDHVEVRLGSGSIDVVAADTDAVSVHWELGGVSGSSPGHFIEDGVLVLDLYCQGACGGDVWLALPDAVDLDVELDRGDVLLHDLGGDVRVRLGAGDVMSGILYGDDIAVAVGAGDLSLDVDARPLDLWADVGAGDLYLGVPAGGYVMDLDVGAGDLWLDGVYEDASAVSRLHAHTGAGAAVVTDLSW
jgi:hypothetical protein